LLLSNGILCTESVAVPGREHEDEDANVDVGESWMTGSGAGMMVDAMSREELLQKMPQSRG
jgi:hypothetical protein